MNDWTIQVRRSLAEWLRARLPAPYRVFQHGDDPARDEVAVLMRDQLWVSNGWTYDVMLVAQDVCMIECVDQLRLVRVVGNDSPESSIKYVWGECMRLEWSDPRLLERAGELVLEWVREHAARC